MLLYGSLFIFAFYFRFLLTVSLYLSPRGRFYFASLIEVAKRREGVSKHHGAVFAPERDRAAASSEAARGCVKRSRALAYSVC